MILRRYSAGWPTLSRYHIHPEVAQPFGFVQGRLFRAQWRGNQPGFRLRDRAEGRKIRGQDTGLAYAPTIPSHKISARSQEVVDYHYDDSKPGKPLRWLIPGGLVAIASFIGLGLVGYGVWVEGGVSSSEGRLWIALLLVPYFGGLYIFCYGYELYDVGRAIKWTLIIGVAGILILAVGIAVLAALSKVKFSSRSSSSSSSSSSGGSSLFQGSGGSSSAAFGGSTPSGGTSSGGPGFAMNLGRGIGFGSSQAPAVTPCPVCGYALPGGPGSPCPYCATQPQVAATAVSQVSGGLIPCPKCGQPITPGDTSECPHTDPMRLGPH